MRFCLPFFAFVSIAAAQGQRQAIFSTDSGGLTPPNGRTARDVAQEYLESAVSIPPEDLGSVYLAKEYRSAHNGVTHLVYRQRFQGIDVFNADWVVNVAPDGSILNAGGLLYPAPDSLTTPGTQSSLNAVRAAAAYVNPRAALTFSPFETAKPERAAQGNGATVRFAAGDFGSDIEGQLVWYGVRGTLRLAWLFQVVDTDRVSAYSVAVEVGTDAVMDSLPMTWFQAPQGLVFDKGSPNPDPTPGLRLTAMPPLVQRVMVPLTGDATVSPAGWVASGATAGNNTIVGENALGVLFANAEPTKGQNGTFSFPLRLGADAPDPLLFTDAANTNLFYWINRVHDLHYEAGFDEGAGNFQQNNFGKGGLAGDPLLVYSHFGSASQVAPQLANSFFTLRAFEDGAPSMVAMFAGYTGPAGYFTDGALDAEVILHEYTHGVSLRLVRQLSTTHQGGSMGEAWSDFYAMEYLLPAGTPVDGIYTPFSYLFNTWGTGIRTRPYSTNTDVNPLTFGDIGKVILPGPEVHADGEIWTEALWEARANLIKQFGETEGRRRIRLLVMDGMKLSVPAPSMIDMRDAILLADRVDFKGASQTQLWEAFAKRGMGALAYSAGGATAHVISSKDLPSPTGRLRFHEDKFVIGETVRVILADSNLSQPTTRIRVTASSGDVEEVVMQRVGSVYVGTVTQAGSTVTPFNGFLTVVPGDDISAHYFDNDPGSGAPRLIQATVPAMPPYSAFIISPRAFPFPNESLITTTRAPVQVNLQFDFPFYDKKYRGPVTVYPTGAIDFEHSVFTSLLRGTCTDVQELRRITGIAPLFASLTFGTAEPNEGIYVSRPTPRAITIRWAAETFTGLTPNNGDPVNFALTLTDGGSIQFFYGSGNQNLHTGFNSSTCGQSPVIGISNGHDTFAQNYVLRSYTNTGITVDPPYSYSSLPVVSVELPAANDTVKGAMTVRGIAYDPGILATGTVVSRIDVFIDKVQRGFTTASVSRTDYCGQNSVPGCPFVGYQLNLNVAALNLSPGPHVLFVRATNSRGALVDTPPVTFNVDSQPARLPKGGIEAPAAGMEVSGAVVFRGYAYADDLRVSRVDLLIDGVTYPTTIYGQSRPDVCAGVSPAPPNCPGVGWSVAVNTRNGLPPLPDGQHSMQLRVLDETGRYTLIPDNPVPFSVKNGPQHYPIGVLTSPSPNAVLKGTVTLSGYAYSPGGRITAALVVVDGSTSPTFVVRLNEPRPNECAALTGVAACPNIGFSVDLDTRNYLNGQHVIGVRLVNDAGLSIIVPGLNRNGMNVVIDNP